MNYLDELKALYPAQDPLGQRFLLTHLSSLPLGIDADALLEFLWAETSSPHATLARQARRELGRVLPAALRQAHGLEEGRLGVWSAYQLGGGGGSLEEAASDPRREKQRGAGWHALTPALERAVALMRGGAPRLKYAASLVAGRFQSQSGVAAVSAGLAAARGDEGTMFAHACALAELAAGAPAGADALLEAIDTGGADEPDLVQLAADLPLANALPVLVRIAAHADTHAGCAIAQALAADTAFAGRALLAELIGRKKAWIVAYALDTIAATPRAEDARVAWDVYRGHKHDFLRVQAAKVLGALPGPEVPGMLERILDDPAPRLKAAALEGMARQRADVRPIVPRLVELLEAPLLRLRVNAMLLLIKREPDAVRAALEALTLSDQAVARVEAAWVMGYLRSSASAEVLDELARGDGAHAVRVQAIKSLAKQEGAAAVPRLARMLEQPDARLVALAARALTAVEPPALPLAVEALAAAAPRATTPAGRGVLLRALGMAASRRADGDAPAALLEALDDREQPVVLGALEGLKGLASAAAADRLRALAAHAEPRVRHRAAVAAFLGGEVAAAEPVLELVRSGEERLALAGLNALLEIAALMPAALEAPRFEALRRALEPRVASTSIEVPARPVAAPRVPPAATQFEPVAAKVDLAPLGERLRSAPPRPARAHDDLPLSSKNVEGTSYLADLARLTPAWQAWLVTYRPLLAIPVVVAAILMLTWREVRKQEAAAPVVGKLTGGSLRVVDVKGRATRETKQGAGPLAPRQVIGPGERVATDAGAQLMLSDGQGGTLWLGESSRVALGQPATDATTPALTPLVFTDPEGDLYVDFRKAPAIEMVAGQARIQTAGGSFRVRTAPQRTVIVSVGPATLVVPGKPPRQLRTGEDAPLP